MKTARSHCFFARNQLPVPLAKSRVEVGAKFQVEVEAEAQELAEAEAVEEARAEAQPAPVELAKLPSELDQRESWPLPQASEPMEKLLMFHQIASNSVLAGMAVPWNVILATQQRFDTFY